MEILDHEQDGAAGREDLEQASESPEDLGQGVGGRAQPEQRADARHDVRLCVPDESLDLLQRRRRIVGVDDPGTRSHRFDHRPERDALAVGEATAAQAIGAV